MSVIYPAAFFGGLGTILFWALIVFWFIRVMLRDPTKPWEYYHSPSRPAAPPKVVPFSKGHVLFGGIIVVWFGAVLVYAIGSKLWQMI